MINWKTGDTVVANISYGSAKKGKKYKVLGVHENSVVLTTRERGWTHGPGVNIYQIFTRITFKEYSNLCG